MSQQFEHFTASSLYCPKCAQSMQVREKLLLVLPDKEIYEYLCVGCASSLGTREVSMAEIHKHLAQQTRPALPLRRPRAKRR